jgi:hypothetical protein
MARLRVLEDADNATDGKKLQGTFGDAVQIQ